MPVTNFTTLGGQVRSESTDGVYTSYTQDPLGIVVATDANANVTYDARYKPYGDILASTGTSTKMTWNGAWGYNPKAGAAHADFYVRARFYSKLEGRWVSVDPLWPNQGAYCYTNSSPVTFSDPSGKQFGGCSGIIVDNAVRPKLCDILAAYLCARCSPRFCMCLSILDADGTLSFDLSASSWIGNNNPCHATYPVKCHRQTTLTQPCPPSSVCIASGYCVFTSKSVYRDPGPIYQRVEGKDLTVTNILFVGSVSAVSSASICITATGATPPGN